jgi:hypothetical protein
MLSLDSMLQALPTNIGQGLKGYPGTNALPYFVHFVSDEEKQFDEIDTRTTETTVDTGVVCNSAAVDWMK